MNLGAVFIEFQSNVNVFVKELRQVGFQLSVMESLAKTNEQSIRSMFVTMMYAGRQALSGFLDAANAAGQLDQALADLSTVLDGTEQSFAQLRDIAISWSNEHVTTSQEITKSMYDMASAGLTQAEVMATVERAATLSVATFGTMNQATRIMTETMISFGRGMSDSLSETEKANKIMEIFAYTVKNFKIVLPEIQRGMAALTGAANALGINVEEAAVAMGILTTEGLSAAQAGTNLKNVFERLGKASNDLNIDMYHTDGTMKSLVEIIEDIEDRMQGTGTAIDQYNKLIQVFGQRGVQAVTVLRSKIDTFRDHTEAVNDSANAYEMAAKREEGFQAQMQILANRVNNLKVAIGDALVGTIKQFSAVIGELLINFQNLDPVLQGFFSNLGLGATVTVVFATGIGMIIAPLKTFLVTLKSVIPAIVGFIAKMGPVAWIITGVVAAVSAWTIASTNAAVEAKKAAAAIEIAEGKILATAKSFRNNVSALKEYVEVSGDVVEVTDDYKGALAKVLESIPGYKVGIETVTRAYQGQRDALLEILGLAAEQDAIIIDIQLGNTRKAISEVNESLEIATKRTAELQSLLSLAEEVKILDLASMNSMNESMQDLTFYTSGYHIKIISLSDQLRKFGIEIQWLDEETIDWAYTLGLINMAIRETEGVSSELTQKLKDLQATFTFMEADLGGVTAGYTKQAVAIIESSDSIETQIAAFENLIEAIRETHPEFADMIIQESGIQSIVESLNEQLIAQATYVDELTASYLNLRAQLQMLEKFGEIAGFSEEEVLEKQLELINNVIDGLERAAIADLEFSTEQKKHLEDLIVLRDDIITQLNEIEETTRKSEEARRESESLEKEALRASEQSAEASKRIWLELMALVDRHNRQIKDLHKTYHDLIEFADALYNKPMDLRVIDSTDVLQQRIQETTEDITALQEELLKLRELDLSDEETTERIKELENQLAGLSDELDYLENAKKNLWHTYNRDIDQTTKSIDTLNNEFNKHIELLEEDATEGVDGIIEDWEKLQSSIVETTNEIEAMREKAKYDPEGITGPELARFEELKQKLAEYEALYADMMETLADIEPEVVLAADEGPLKKMEEAANSLSEGLAQAKAEYTAFGDSARHTNAQIRETENYLVGLIHLYNSLDFDAMEDGVEIQEQLTEEIENTRKTLAGLKVQLEELAYTENFFASLEKAADSLVSANTEASLMFEFFGKNMDYVNSQLANTNTHAQELITILAQTDFSKLQNGSIHAAGLKLQIIEAANAVRQLEYDIINMNFEQASQKASIYFELFGKGSDFMQSQISNTEALLDSLVDAYINTDWSSITTSGMVFTDLHTELEGIESQIQSLQDTIDSLDADGWFDMLDDGGELRANYEKEMEALLSSAGVLQEYIDSVDWENFEDGTMSAEKLREEIEKIAELLKLLQFESALRDIEDSFARGVERAVLWAKATGDIMGMLQQGLGSTKTALNDLIDLQLDSADLLNMETAEGITAFAELRLKILEAVEVVIEFEKAIINLSFDQAMKKASIYLELFGDNVAYAKKELSETEKKLDSFIDILANTYWDAMESGQDVLDSLNDVVTKTESSMLDLQSQIDNFDVDAFEDGEEQLQSLMSQMEGLEEHSSKIQEYIGSVDWDNVTDPKKLMEGLKELIRGLADEIIRLRIEVGMLEIATEFDRATESAELFYRALGEGRTYLENQLSAAKSALQGYIEIQLEHARNLDKTTAAGLKQWSEIRFAILNAANAIKQLEKQLIDLDYRKATEKARLYFDFFGDSVDLLSAELMAAESQLGQLTDMYINTDWNEMDTAKDVVKELEEFIEQAQERLIELNKTLVTTDWSTLEDGENVMAALKQEIRLTNEEMFATQAYLDSLDYANLKDGVSIFDALQESIAQAVEEIIRMRSELARLQIKETFEGAIRYAEIWGKTMGDALTGLEMQLSAAITQLEQLMKLQAAGDDSFALAGEIRDAQKEVEKLQHMLLTVQWNKAFEGLKESTPIWSEVTGNIYSDLATIRSEFAAFEEQYRKAIEFKQNIPPGVSVAGLNVYFKELAQRHGQYIAQIAAAIDAAIQSIDTSIEKSFMFIDKMAEIFGTEPIDVYTQKVLILEQQIADMVEMFVTFHQEGIEWTPELEAKLQSLTEEWKLLNAEIAELEKAAELAAELEAELARVEAAVQRMVDNINSALTNIFVTFAHNVASMGKDAAWEIAKQDMKEKIRSAIFEGVIEAVLQSAMIQDKVRALGEFIAKALEDGMISSGEWDFINLLTDDLLNVAESAGDILLKIMERLGIMVASTTEGAKNVLWTMEQINDPSFKPDFSIGDITQGEMDTQSMALLGSSIMALSENIQPDSQLGDIVSIGFADVVSHMKEAPAASNDIHIGNIEINIEAGEADADTIADTVLDKLSDQLQWQARMAGARV